MRTAAASVLSLAALIAASASAAELTRDELKKALDNNPDLVLEAISKNPKALMETLQHAQQAAQEQAEQDELDKAFKNPLKAEIDAHSHLRGKKDAKYTLVEYSDFQCPYCGRGFLTVEQLRKKYGDDLRFIYKNNPLPMHPQAMPAAKYFEAAALQSQDKAWKLHDKMFENQQKLSEQFLLDSAKEVGLDVDKLKKDAGGDEVKKRIQADVDEAEKLGMQGTPGFLLNGIPIRGAYPFDYFEKIIDRLEQEKN